MRHVSLMTQIGVNTNSIYREENQKKKHQNKVQTNMVVTCFFVVSIEFLVCSPFHVSEKENII